MLFFLIAHFAFIIIRAFHWTTHTIFISIDSCILTYPIFKRILVPCFKNIGVFCIVLSVLMIIPFIFVNIFSLDIQGSLWSLLLASCLFYTFISFKTIFSKKMHTGSKILIQLLLLSALAIIIDIFTGFRRWSTSFVGPSLSIVSSLVIVFIAAGRRSLYKEFSGYLLTSFLVSIIPALLCLIKLSTHVWVGYAAFLVSLLMLLGLYVFSEKDFKNEMKKRFHF